MGGHLRLELLETHCLTYYTPAPVKSITSSFDGIVIPDSTLSHNHPRLGQQDPLAPGASDSALAPKSRIQS